MTAGVIHFYLDSTLTSQPNQRRLTARRIFAERSRSAARDLGLSINSDFIARPLHRVVRSSVFVHFPEELLRGASSKNI
jgi:hypothetical protein